MFVQCISCSWDLGVEGKCLELLESLKCSASLRLLKSLRFFGSLGFGGSEGSLAL